MKKEISMPSHMKTIQAWEAHQYGIYGTDIGIAVLDTGIYPHPDFSSKNNCIKEFSDFINNKPYPYDDANHGTHICGIITSKRKDANGNYYGIAPKSHLICAKILDAKGNGKTTTALAAFQWILQIRDLYNIRIINLSMGMPVHKPEDEFSPFMESIRELWDMGFVIIVAAGNNGPENKSITAPGIGRKLITVGACEDSFSSHGPTINCIKKPDLCAPGKNIYSCSNQGGYIYKSGTSMATPMVSAAAALLLSKEPHLSNKEIKKRLLSSSRDLGLPWQQQGAGMLDIKKLLQI